MQCIPIYICIYIYMIGRLQNGSLSVSYVHFKVASFDIREADLQHGR